MVCYQETVAWKYTQVIRFVVVTFVLLSNKGAFVGMSCERTTNSLLHGPPKSVPVLSLFTDSSFHPSSSLVLSPIYPGKISHKFLARPSWEFQILSLFSVNGSCSLLKHWTLSTDCSMHFASYMGYPSHLGCPTDIC